MNLSDTDATRIYHMTEDGDRLLNIIGAVLVLALIASLGLTVFAALNSSPSPQTDRASDINWRLQRINVTHARITHVGGGSISAAELTVTVDGRARSTSWSGSLTNKDTSVVQARGGQVVRLYWTSARDDRKLLKQWTLSEDDS